MPETLTVFGFELVGGQIVTLPVRQYTFNLN